MSRSSVHRHWTSNGPSVVETLAADQDGGRPNRDRSTKSSTVTGTASGTSAISGQPRPSRSEAPSAATAQRADGSRIGWQVQIARCQRSSESRGRQGHGRPGAPCCGQRQGLGWSGKCSGCGRGIVPAPSGVVGAAVIDDDNLDVAASLGQGTLHRLANELAIIEGRDNNGDTRAMKRRH